MKAIVEKSTGKVLYCSLEEVILKDNEVMIDFTTLEFNEPYYNFLTEQFYETLDILPSLTEEQIALNKEQVYSQLQETDWYVVRMMETGKPIPQEILDQREQLRNSV